MLFEKLLSKQIADFFERILSKCQCGFCSRKGYGSQHCLQMMLETRKQATNNENKAFGALLTNLSSICLLK